MKIEYTIKETYPNIFEIYVPDDYDRAMLFCRVQEYYESGEFQFKGKVFSMWDYMKWYSTKHGSFSYAADWAGFNFPFEIAKQCMAWSSTESPYDTVMKEIILDISTSRDKNYREISYILGLGDNDKNTYLHELCHAFYYTNKEYKKEVDQIIDDMSKKTYNAFKKELINMGYDESVVSDEIQAYMSTEPYKYFSKINKSVKKELYNQFKKVLKKYK